MTDNKIKQQRFSGLTDTIDYYANMVGDGHALGPEQRSQLQEVVNTVSCFGEDAQKWVDLGNEILNK